MKARDTALTGIPEKSCWVRQNTALLGLFVLLVVGIARSQTADMPLGDLVKQPKPERKAARVITNDDLPARPPSTTSVVSQPNKSNDEPASGDTTVAPKNQVVAKRLAELKKAEDAENQLISRIEQKLNDDSEQLSAQQRQSYTNALKQSQATVDSYREQRTMLEAAAAKTETEEEAKEASGSTPAGKESGKSTAAKPSRLEQTVTSAQPGNESSPVESAPTRLQSAEGETGTTE